MSEGDISDVPDEIERVVEGGGDNREVSDNENEDEQKEDANKQKEKEKVRKRTGPRIVLNPTRLKGPRGLGIMESFFSDIKLHGKGRESEDLNLVMQRLEHWTHRLIPRMQFDDCLKKIEKLGSKKEIANYVNRIRLDMESEDVPSDVMAEDAPDSPPPIDDPFDQLINSTTGSVNHATTEITSEQREQILRNRLLAEERRAARIKKAQEMKEKFLATQTQYNNSQEHAVIDKSNEDNSSETNQQSTELQTNNIGIAENITMLGIQPEAGIQSERFTDITEHLSEMPLDVENSSSKTIENRFDILENNYKKGNQLSFVEQESFNEEMQVNCEEIEEIKNPKSISKSVQDVHLPGVQIQLNNSEDIEIGFEQTNI